MRDWLYVDDHVRALVLILLRGRVGETYNVGGRNEQTNLAAVTRICAVMDEVRPEDAPHSKLVSPDTDRPGHDRRYAIDASKLETRLATENFAKDDPRVSRQRGVVAAALVEKVGVRHR